MGVLARADLTRFWKALAHRLPCLVRVILTGGGEAMLLGGRRPTGDLDFGVELTPRWAHHWPDVERAIAEAAGETGVAVQYSTEIDRWSPVSVPVLRRRSRRWERHGRLDVHLLDPACWAVYKLARYFDSDVQDLREVLRAEGVTSRRLAAICGESLRASPRSPQLFSFRRQVEHFFREHGPMIWGRKFDAEGAVQGFQRAAGLRPAS